MKDIITATLASCIVVFLAVMLSTVTQAGGKKCPDGQTLDEKTGKCVQLRIEGAPLVKGYIAKQGIDRRHGRRDKTKN